MKPGIPKMSKKAFAIIFLLLLIGGVLLTVYQVGRQQEIRQKAAPLACMQAICRWDSLPGASSYVAVINIIENGAGYTIKSETVTSSSPLQILFPIQPGKTYECRVVAVNNCGGGPISLSSQTACPGETLTLTTPSPTPTPTPSPTPTATPTPTPTPSPTPTSTPTPTPTPSPTPTVYVPPPTVYVPPPTAYIPPPTAYVPPPTATPTIVPTGPGDKIIGVGTAAVIFSILGGIIFFLL